MKGGRGPKFQSANVYLKSRLKEVLSSTDDRVLICVPSSLTGKAHLRMTNEARFFWKKYAARLPFLIYSILFRRRFGDSLFTRPYMDYIKDGREYERASKQFELIKRLWDGRRVLIVEGQESRIGVGNDLLENACSVGRILCPKYDAWRFYPRILKQSLKEAMNFDIVLIALGPTATVLAYDLARNGVWAVDVGHVDIEYEWFLSRSNHKEKIQNKHTNEAVKDTQNANDFVDRECSKKYYQEVICNIF